MERMSVVQPPIDIFENKGFQNEPAKSVVVPMTSYIYDHLETEWRGKTGMYAFFRDCPFPAKGFPFPQAILACNHAKRFFKRGIDALTDKNMFLLWGAFLISPSRKSTLENWMGAYADSATFIMEPYFVSRERMTECARELQDFMYNFFVRIEIDPTIARNFSKVFSMLIQYDDAYRIRIEDLMSETTKEVLMRNPSKEIKRLISILNEREPGQENINKFKKIQKILSFLFFIPSVKRAFKDTLAESDFSNFQLDDADRYHSMLREDYMVCGIPVKERIEMYKAWHSVFPPLPPRIPVQLQP